MPFHLARLTRSCHSYSTSNTLMTHDSRQKVQNPCRERKGSYLRNLFKGHSDSLEFTIVEDIITPGAFNESIKGVAGIIHSASPLIPKGDPTVDSKGPIEPAVIGTFGIL